MISLWYKYIFGFKHNLALIFFPFSTSEVCKLIRNEIKPLQRRYSIYLQLLWRLTTEEIISNLRPKFRNEEKEGHSKTNFLITTKRPTYVQNQRTVQQPQSLP